MSLFVGLTRMLVRMPKLCREEAAEKRKKMTMKMESKKTAPGREHRKYRAGEEVVESEGETDGGEMRSCMHQEEALTPVYKFYSRSRHSLYQDRKCLQHPLPVPRSTAKI